MFREIRLIPRDQASGEYFMANGLRWLNKIVNAFTGAFIDSRQIKYSHEFGTVNHGKGEFRLDGGQTFGSFLTDTVGYYH